MSELPLQLFSCCLIGASQPYSGLHSLPSACFEHMGRVYVFACMYD